MMMDTKPTILYVDDEVSNLDAFMAAFRRAYNVKTASNVSDAIRILESEPVEVIITDQRMPDMTGVQFLEAIIPEYPDPVRMLLTGFSDIDAIIKAINNGRVFRYLTKPWDEKELLLSIDHAVKVYQLESTQRKLVKEMQSETLRQAHILDVFKRYVPTNIIENSLSSDISELFSGESRVITVLFISIVGDMEEIGTVDPNVIFNYLNRYFTIITDCVESHKGTFDKLIGFNAMAIFGAPVSYLDNAKNAAFCSISIKQKIQELNESMRNEVGLELGVSMAIHSGEAVVGNIGSPETISYTAIGDTVNTTARILEVACKYSNTILMSDMAYQAAKNHIKVEELGKEEMRGKKESIMLYKIIGKTK